MHNDHHDAALVKSDPIDVGASLDRRRFLLGTAVAAATAMSIGAIPERVLAAGGSPAPSLTHDTAPNRFVDVKGVRYAYRRFGVANGHPPIVFLQHYIGTMDWWDPALTDGFAASREVILFDNRGVGLTSGDTPNRITAMADDVHDFIGGLGLVQVDVLAFSIGGMVGQELALRHSSAVRKLILAGTGPRGGSGMASPKPNVGKALADAGSDPRSARPYLFFSQSEKGRAAGLAFVARSERRKTDPDKMPSHQTMEAHNEALAEFGAAGQHDAYIEKLRGLTQPTLIVNGNNDIMVDTVNSFDLSQAIPRSELVVYPDAGHGSLFQYASLFVAQANLFVDRSDF